MNSFPDDPLARAAVDDWLAGGESATLYGNGMDFTGADFSGLFFYEVWALQSNFSNTRLRQVDMPAANLTASNFRGADMTGVIMPDAHAGEADFSGARMTGSNLRELDARDAVFRAADLAGSEIGGAVDGSDLRGADLTGVRFIDLDLHRAVLCGAILVGAHGVVFGPFLADVDGEERLVAGREAKHWFAHRGAHVDVRELNRLTSD